MRPSISKINPANVGLVGRTCSDIIPLSLFITLMQIILFFCQRVLRECIMLVLLSAEKNNLDSKEFIP